MMRSLFVALLALQVHAKDDCGRYRSYSAETMASPIVGGWDAREGEFPWMVSLQDWSGQHFCGGAIVGNHWILTAAHCLELLSEFDFKIVSGSNRLDAKHELTEHIPHKIHLHPSFSSNNYIDDLALIRTDTDIHMKELKTSKVCLPDERHHLPSHVTAAGWGQTSTEDKRSVYHLKAVDLQVVNHSQCHTKYIKHGINIGNKTFCAGAHDKDTCKNDSGGPVIQRTNGKATVVGITSHGPPNLECAHPDWASVYTEVSKYTDFISNLLRT